MTKGWYASRESLPFKSKLKKYNAREAVFIASLLNNLIRGKTKRKIPIGSYFFCWFNLQSIFLSKSWLFSCNSQRGKGKSVSILCMLTPDKSYMCIRSLEQTAAWSLCWGLLKYSGIYESLISKKLWDQSIHCFGYKSVLKSTDYSSGQGKEPGTNAFELMSFQVVGALLSSLAFLWT